MKTSILYASVPKLLPSYTQMPCLHHKDLCWAEDASGLDMGTVMASESTPSFLCKGESQLLLPYSHLVARNLVYGYFFLLGLSLVPQTLQDFLFTEAVRWL